MVNQAWRSLSHQSSPSRFYKHLFACRHALWYWNKAQLGNLQTNITTTREALAKVQQLSPFNDDVAAIDSNLRGHLEYHLKLEEIYWLQKSRLKWQIKGDWCTRFFFLSILARRKNNRIECIKDESGIWLSSREDIGNAFLGKLSATYDEDLSPTNIDLSHLISPSISVEDNVRLIAIPDWDEIRNTMFRMGSFKATEPYGMPSLFYKTYWNIVGDDVVAIVRNFFITGHLHPYLNQSNIILVPKGPNASTNNQFRPIAVCNAIYKVISKLLTNRVMPLLSKLICPTQNVFVPSCSIHTTLS